MRYFLKEIENMFSVFLSSYRNTRESLGEPAGRVPTAFLVLPNFHSCFYLTIRPVARKGYGSIAHEAKPNGLLTRGP